MSSASQIWAENSKSQTLTPSTFYIRKLNSLFCCLYVSHEQESRVEFIFLSALLQRCLEEPLLLLLLLCPIRAPWFSGARPVVCVSISIFSFTLFYQQCTVQCSCWLVFLYQLATGYPPIHAPVPVPDFGQAPYTRDVEGPTFKWYSSPSSDYSYQLSPHAAI